MEEQQDSSSNYTELLQPGKYVFTGALQEHYAEGSVVPYFSAEAIMIIPQNDQFNGAIKPARISDLILKQSTFIDENGTAREAHKLYTWPKNLGSTAQWTANKRSFFEEFLLNFPIEITKVQDDHQVSWKYITPENFKKFPANLQGTPEFEEFSKNKETYFFLRRPLDLPK